MSETQFTFNISLSVLNHLGRNLYRNFITVLGEAISNSWDADAKNVWIYIDRENGTLVIKDDGDGMSEDDFREKFLKVGYTKRGHDNTNIESPKGRPYIGRKGIGKLALLSCAKKISVISKQKGGKYVGGTIDNSALDTAISEDSTNYSLEDFDMDIFNSYAKNHTHGTIIFFKEIHDGIKKSEEYLKKILALYFRFSLIDPSFHIFLNDSEITESDLGSLAKNTQFLWNINTLDDPYITQELTELKNSDLFTLKTPNIEGFIASVILPRFLKITNTEEKAGIDLFVNGRLRERNILKHMPAFETRHIASYLYGQIHYNELDDGDEDSFTSSRESMKEGVPEFESFLEVFENEILKPLADTWDKWRLEANEDGDDDNPRKTIKQRRASSLFNQASKDYLETDNSKVEQWIKELKPESEFNIPSYVDCFLSENLVRKYILEKKIIIKPSSLDFIEQRKTSEATFKQDGNVNIEIRKDEDDLEYMEMSGLAAHVESGGVQNTIVRDAKTYRPIRNAVAHTSLITDEAKRRLTAVYENIKARINSLLTE